MKKPQSIKIDTPVGSIESDSGNHMVDILTIVTIVVVFLLTKKYLWSK